MIDKNYQTNHWKSKDKKIVQSYWESPPATKRSLWLCEQLKQYDFSSIFECGFFSGRNLRYICDHFPNKEVSGLEINKVAIDFAKQKLPKLNLIEKNIYDVDQIGKKYDIIFTSGVLIHIVPQDIENIVKKMITVCNKYIIHVEDVGKNEVVAGPKNLKPVYKISDQVQFAPDLISFYDKVGFKSEIISLPKEIQTNGAKHMLVVNIK